MMSEIRLPPADEIVDNTNPKTAFAQQVDHVAADKPGASGDKCDWPLRPRFYGIRCICLFDQAELVPVIRKFVGGDS